MSGIHPSLLCLATGAVLFLVPAALTAQEPFHGDLTEATATISNRLGKSPIENFRKMINMRPTEWDAILTNYPAEKRKQIAQKVQEYQMLPEPFRELRLRATELRWYLLPLLNMPATNRAERLKLVPEPYQQLVAARVQEWDLWPPAFQQDLLDFQSTMELVNPGSVDQASVWMDKLPPRERHELENKLARWQAMPAPQRQQMYTAFQHYFELSEPEKEKTMQALSGPERQETEKVLDPIEKWPKPQQEKYIYAFRRLGNMSPQERQQFLKNAERWKQMSEAEREAWRNLVKNVPPLPPGFVAPRPSATGPGVQPPAKTNPTAGPLK